MMNIPNFVVGATGVLLLLLQISSGLPTEQIEQAKPPFMTDYPGCDNYIVRQNEEVRNVVLDESITLLVKPNQPTVFMDIVVSDEKFYQATVMGSMVKLELCNMDRTDCTVVDEGGSKSSDLLKVNDWNKIQITLVDDQITVDINLKKNVMGKLMAVQWDDEHQHSNVKVSIRPSPVPDFKLFTTVLCNETHSPIVEMKPRDPTMTTVKAEVVDPFPDCPVHVVKNNMPLENLMLDNTLELAVLPSEPSLHLNISFQETLYKASIRHTMTQIYKCSKDATHCEMVDEGGAKDSNTLVENKWNFMTISLEDGKVTVEINQRKNAMRTDMVFSPDADHAMVSIFAVRDNSTAFSSFLEDDYSIRVNVNCEESLTTLDESYITTEETFYTTTGNSTDSESSPQESNSHQVYYILLAVVLVLLAVFVGLIVFNKCKKGNEEYELHQQQK